jgi:hypothetical protein
MNLETPKLVWNILVRPWPPVQNLVTIGSQGPEHQNPRFMSISVFFFFIFFFFSLFFDGATARTAEPILMVDGSKDVFSSEEVPLRGHIVTWSKMWAWLPKNPLFWALFGQNEIRGQECAKTSVPRRLLVRFQSTRAQMMQIPTRSKGNKFCVT